MNTNSRWPTIKGAVYLEGVFLDDPDVLELANRLRAAGFDTDARNLEASRRRGDPTLLALDLTEREAVVRALEECPEGPLADLRDTMLRELSWLRESGVA